MSAGLADGSSNVIPITPITKASLAQWIESHPGQRQWLNITAFKADPGSFAFLPTLDGEPVRVLAARGEGEPLWAFAAFPTSLPAGVYAIDAELGKAEATAAALGW